MYLPSWKRQECLTSDWRAELYSQQKKNNKKKQFEKTGFVVSKCWLVLFWHQYPVPLSDTRVRNWTESSNEAYQHFCKLTVSHTFMHVFVFFLHFTVIASVTHLTMQVLTPQRATVATNKQTACTTGLDATSWKRKRLYLLIMVWILTSFYNTQLIVQECERKLPSRLQCRLSGFLSWICVKFESEEVTTHWKYIHTHTLTHAHQCWCEWWITECEVFSRHRKEHPWSVPPLSPPCWGLMIRNIVRLVMKTLNPRLPFQGGRFIDEIWCYDSEGLPDKTLSAPPAGQ